MGQERDGYVEDDRINDSGVAHLRVLRVDGAIDDYEFEVHGLFGYGYLVRPDGGLEVTTTATTADGERVIHTVVSATYAAGQWIRVSGGSPYPVPTGQTESESNAFIA